jgi:hypothetical protein
MSPEIDSQDEREVRSPGAGDASMSAAFERSPLVLSRRVGASWLVTTPDDPDVHELQGGAAIVWERLSRPTLIDAVTEDLRAAGVEVPDLGSQVECVLQSFRALGLLHEVRTQVGKS